MKFIPTLLCLVCWYVPNISAQDYYRLEGPSEVDCNPGPHYYFINTQTQLDYTDWVLITPSGVIETPCFGCTNNVYGIDLFFYEFGEYLLLATSYTINETLTDSMYIFVYNSTEQPEVIGCFEQDSTTGCYNVCAFSQITIHHPDDNIGFEILGAESYEYYDQFNDGFIDITWGAGGEGAVFIYSHGCDVELCFNILPEPIADFTTNPAATSDTLTVCKNQEVYFENLSVHGLNYTWLFGDGEESDSYDASHTYGTEGFYTATLQANSICECADEKQIVIEVLPAPAPVLDCVNTVCPETRQRYQVTPSDCAQYVWTISSNGTIVNGGELTDNFIEVIWHEGPDGIIELSISGCATTYCAFTNVFRVPIITPEGPIDGDASVCSGEISTYTAPYFPGTQYHWEVGASGTILGGQNTNGITVKWANVNTPTPTNVEVEYDNCFLECSGNDVFNVNISPEIRLNGDVQVCQNQSATATAEAGFSFFTPVNVSWHIEDADGAIVFTSPGLSSSFSHTFNYPPGEYAWVATNTSDSYCTEIIRKTISVTALPPAPLGIIGEEKICPGQLYGFTIESAGNYGISWLITDGTTTHPYTGQSCQHTFGPTPPYIVQAQHTDVQYDDCASDPISITLGTATDLVINGPDEVCFNAIDSFNTGYISGADYNWEIIPADHGEIRRSDLNNVNVFWTQTGIVTLRLNICGVSIDKTILVRALPAYNILGPTAACANELVAITTDQPLLAHQWVDENDNIFSVQNNVQLSPGSFGVEITDAFGCSNEKTAQITSYPAPTVHLSTPYDQYYCTNIPGGAAITANTDGTDYTFTWFLDDVEIGPGGPVFGVTTFGEYHVVVANQYGCKAISEKISFENCCPPDVCGAGVPGLPGGCVALENDFNIGLLETECHIHQHAPAFPGITPGSTQWQISSRSEGVIAFENVDILNHTYDKPGYYQVMMFALINGFPYNATVCGHFDNLVDTVRAVADFASTGICASTPVEFEDLTTFLPMETISSWSWNFGDPASGSSNNSISQHPTHTFSAPGSYEVKLTVTLTSGCYTTKKRTIHLSGGPVLLPQFDFIHCVDEAMAFQLPGDLYDIQWNFGDPGSGSENTAIENSVFHTFDATGTFSITVEANDVYECRSQAGFMVDIIANTLSGLIDVNPILPLCAGDTAVLTAPTGGLSWSWSTEETTSVIEVTESNQYSVLIRDQYNCTYSPPPVFVNVFPKPEVVIRAREIYGPDDFGPWTSSLSICFGSEFELSAFSTGSVSYHWTNGETTQLLQFTSEGANLPAPGEYEFTINTIDLFNNCISDSSSILIEIFALPQTPMISIASGAGCSFSPNVLQVSNPESGIIYSWSDGQEGTSITVTKPGAYQVTAINQNGCSALSNTIIINPSAPVDQIPGGCFIKCDPLNVCLPPLSDVSSYTIYQDGNIFQSGTTWPSDFVITMDGSYTIEVTTTNGCVATSDPLDVVLYTGVGSITVETWLDQDGDGVISSGDVLLSGIPIQIISDDGLHIGKTETIPGGQFVFMDFPATQYLAHIDRTLLSSQYIVVIDSLTTQIATCDDSVVVSLLLKENCTVTGPDQFFELCPGESLVLGDSIWTDIGSYEMHMISTFGCDSIFQVMITPPDSIEINVTVWVDVDHDGVVSPSDTTIQGITIILDRQISSDPFTGVTGPNGELNGIYPVGNYVVFVDTMLLPPGLMVVFGEEYLSDTACSLVEMEFLLVSACTGVFIVHQATICQGDSLLVDGQWLTDEGQYTFVHTDSVTLCDTIIDVYVTLSEEIVIESITDWNCETLGSIQLEISGEAPFTITWDNGFSGDSLLTDLDEGIYVVTVADANGCVAADTIEVIASPLLSFSVPGEYVVELGDSVLITIAGNIDEPGLTFEWSPAGILSCPTCSASYATPTNDTIVTIQITDADSCVYFLETYIDVTTDTIIIDEIFVPNVFSPNGDGTNDYWRIFSKLDNTHVQNLYVYDRWGTLVFYKENYVLNTFMGWDGKFNGNMMNPGVFVYQANVTLGDGREAKVKGDVTLLR